MHWDVVEVKAEPDHRLFVRFADGTSGKVQLDLSELRGVLAPLRDPSFFERAFVDHGAVAWSGDIDLAPDAMYERVVKQGSLA
jgi:Protein of unknown function (DUF2442)